MPSGLFVSDCSSSDWAWLDFGCTFQNLGTDVGGGVGSALSGALQPVETLLLILGGLIIVILIIVAVSPNVKHIVPAFL
jgi:hypothetical protein